MGSVVWVGYCGCCDGQLSDYEARAEICSQCYENDCPDCKEEE
jgi:hypothetical protein